MKSIAAQTATAPIGAAPPSAGYDLVIRAGAFHDGSGGEPYPADVATEGDVRYDINSL